MIGDQEPDQHLTFVWTGIGKMRSKGASHFDNFLRVLEEGVTHGHYVFQIHYVMIHLSTKFHHDR
jgi:hypothetical protein